ncbi:MAG: hypothetical protein QM626_07595 [Microbacterium sp.]|uniref:hypothetical protein n=1 Tax=Microbacterium sp. TaxID=51671 RepID=UPI0039E6AB1F
MADPQRDAARRRGWELFEPVAAPYLARAGVDIGRMFGSEGLRVRGKVFAFLGFDGDLVVKVPAGRSEELCATTPATRMLMRGREMREWLVLRQEDAGFWPDAVAEAYAYLDRITP